MLYFYIYEIVTSGVVAYVEDAYLNLIWMINTIAKGPCWILGKGEWEPIEILIVEPEKGDLIGLILNGDILEILMDILTLWFMFANNLNSFEYVSFYDAGMISAKSVVNAGFATY